jgi:alpha-beta hydrolase superfamily lysophospholipase
MQHIEFTRKSPDGLDFFFQGWQPDTQPKAVVCLVHGLGEHSGRYAHVAAALNDAGYALLGFDLRGHGKSGGPRGHTQTYDVLMEDIDRLLDDAAQRYPGILRFLYGHSLGGGLVLNYALRRAPQIAGVISTSPWVRLSFAPSTVLLTTMRIMDRVMPAFAQNNGLSTKDLSHDPEVVRAYESDPLVHDRISARVGLSMLNAGESALAHAAEWPATLPLLLVHGTADRITSATATQEFAAKVPGDCTLKLWEGFYHETHNEPEKAEVLAFMIDWLQKHTPA